ncbi:hypothetical protein [Spartinivicinus ruber]|uniref:hypothetical protein n=1 Tax=Spartinivicinus ruber TaxID=2683272 RepID=UPI001CA443A2|nr:hypothetical protein [Spartinivicinus ruber]
MINFLHINTSSASDSPISENNNRKPITKVLFILSEWVANTDHPLNLIGDFSVATPDLALAVKLPPDEGNGEPPALPSIDSIVEQMQAGQWYYVKTHNTLAEVFPPQHEDWSIIGPMAVLTAWSGGAINDHELLVWGGGHGDYGGNEVYLFNFEKLRWQRATEPSRYKKNNIKKCVDNQNNPSNDCITLDGAATSAHSYDAIQYLPKLKKFWLGPGSIYRSGRALNDTYLFNTKTKQWQQQMRLPISGYLSSAVEPTTGNLLIANGNYLLGYDPVSQQPLFKSLSGPDYGGASPGAYALKQQRFIQLLNSSVVSYDLTNVDWQSLQINTFVKLPIEPRHHKLQINHNGAWQPFQLGQQQLSHEPASFRQFGIDYDPEQNLFALWDGHKNVVVLDPTTWRLMELKNLDQTNTPSVFKAGTSQRKGQGIFGRWRYSHKWRCFIGFNDAKQGLWLYRLPIIH